MTTAYPPERLRLLVNLIDRIVTREMTERICIADHNPASRGYLRECLEGHGG
jgi:hypothetical protein